MARRLKRGLFLYGLCFSTFFFLRLGYVWIVGPDSEKSEDLFKSPNRYAKLVVDSREHVEVYEQSATLQLRSTDYEQDLNRVDTIVDDEHVEIESLEESDTDFRVRRMMLSVESSRLDAVMASLQGVANVISSTSSKNRVTEAYTEDQRRQKTLQNRLNELLRLKNESKDVESLIALDERIAEIEEELSDIETWLHRYGENKGQSTIKLTIVEDVSQIARILADQIVDSLEWTWDLCFTTTLLLISATILLFMLIVIQDRWERIHNLLRDLVDDDMDHH